MKVKVVSYMEVDYNELDKAISKFYGQSFECVPTEEWNNDSSYDFDIKKAKLSDYDKKKIEEYKSGECPSYIVRTLLVDMCNQGEIEPGHYLIQVCW